MRTQVSLSMVVALLLLGGLTGCAGDGDNQNGQSSSPSPTKAVASFDECVAAGYTTNTATPRVCTDPAGATFTEAPQNTVDTYTSPKGVVIKLDNFPSGKTISSPVTITGEVPGSWSFEADFPVVLVDWDGRIIAQGPAQLQGDWMTDELVPFTVTLKFKTPTYKNNGALILQRDNPSGLAKHDDALEIPVLFE